MRYRKMMDYFEDYYRDSSEMNALMKMEAALLDQVAFDIGDVFKQSAIQQATWMIPVYEEIFELLPDQEDTLEFRRKRLIAYQRLRSPTTRKEFKNYLLPFVETVEIIEHFKDYLVEFTFTGDDINFKEINRMLRRSLPAHLGWQLALKWYQQIHIRHVSEVMALVETRQNVWNFGEVRSTCFDDEFDFDRTIRLDGIYGKGYRDRQQHNVGIWFAVEAWQRNLMLVNVFDGNFDMDRSHTWSGSALKRPPISKIIAHEFVCTNQAAYKLKNKIEAMSRPEIYLNNLISYESNNLQSVNSSQQLIIKTISDAMSAEVATHKLQIQSVQQCMQNETASGKTNIQVSISNVNQGVARYNTDYRTVNMADGSFCMDGSHGFDGAQQQNVARVTHCCTITKITKNGVGRTERV